MKKTILFSFAISLALISCQKQTDETAKAEQISKPSITINGKEYPVQFILENMSKSSGIPIDSLEYHEDTKLFGIKGYYPNMNPSYFLNN